MVPAHFLPEFGDIDSDRVLSEDELYIVISDRYPVSPGRSLVVPKRAISRFRELTAEEKSRLTLWIDWCMEYLEETLDPRPDGFNVGLNDGISAGQTIRQLPVHVIPRYLGDVGDPRGGIRFVIPQKARYWTS